MDVKQITGEIPIEQRKKILLLSDDMRMPSGIGTMSKQIVINTAHYFNWVQLGAAINHPDKGKVIDLSNDVNKIPGIDTASVKLYPFDTYGNPDILRAIISIEKPDAILHFTDPRQWIWLYNMSHEIRQNIPIMYYNIWDCPPAPLYNRDFYRSCDLIMNISHQTHALVETVLGKDVYYDISTEYPYRYDNSKVYISYVPHGANKTSYHPVQDEEKNDFKKKHNITSDFIIFWNNRNIRRKMQGDVILAFKKFINNLDAEKRNRCQLIMHTVPIDENGTDLNVVIRDLASECNISIIDAMLTDYEMNLYYNIADVTINIASNEGFGLSSMESLSAGTMIINNVTGGLQDQCRFEDENGNWIKHDSEFHSNHEGKYKKCGIWAIPVFPSSISLQGSPPTPYIYDDRCSINDVATAIETVYNLSKEERKLRGKAGYDWVTGPESMMSAINMGANMIKYISYVLNNWSPIPKFKVINAIKYEPFKAKAIC